MTTKITYTKDENGNETVMSVKSPYNTNFLAMARKLHGKFNTQTKTWDFSTKTKSKVLAALKTVYDYEEEGTVTEKVDIEVTFNNTVHSEKGSLILAGRIVAVGTDRDSGAYEGKDISLIEGEISTDGSRKNWYTYIAAESVLEVYNVDKKTLKEWDKLDSVSYKIIDKK